MKTVNIILATLLFASLGLAETQVSAEAHQLTREHAREMALANNPALAGFGARLRAAEGARAQATALPNPELGFEMEGFGGQLPGNEAAESVLALSQTIETGGKRRLRREAAAAEEHVVAMDWQAYRLSLLALVDRRFAALLAAQERLTLTSQAQATAAEVTAAVAAMVEAGSVSPIEHLRAESEQALAELDTDRARRDLETARIELAELLGRSPGDPLVAVGTLPGPTPPPALAELLLHVATLPDLERAAAAVELAEAEESLARSGRIPDLAVTFGGKHLHDLGKTGLVAGVGVAIPLFDRRTGAIAEASAGLDAARQDARSEELRLAAGLAAAHATYVQANEEASRVEDEVVPRTQRIYEALAEGYRRGKFPLLDLLQARRSLTESQLRLVDARQRLAEARSTLERLAGVPLAAHQGAQS